MGAAFWALSHACSFQNGIEQVIHEGGDADTNAAVVGAILGARDGFDSFPVELVSGLQNQLALDKRVNTFFQMI